MEDLKYIFDTKEFQEEMEREMLKRRQNSAKNLMLITPELIAKDDELNAMPEIFIDPIERSHLTDKEMKEAFGGW